MYNKLRELGLSPEHADELSKKLDKFTPRNKKIFLLWAGGSTYRQLGIEFGVSHNYIKRLLHSIRLHGRQKIVLYSIDKSKKQSANRDRRKPEKVKPVVMRNTKPIYEAYEDKSFRTSVEVSMMKAYGRHKITFVDNCIDKDDFRQEMWCQLFEEAPADCQKAHVLQVVFSNAKDFSKKLRSQRAKPGKYSKSIVYESMENGNYMRMQSPNYEELGASE